MRKIEEFEVMAREMVGDGKSPNLFFVSGKTGAIQMVTTDFEAAYSFWRGLPRGEERNLEDRKWGTICSTSPESDEPGARLYTTDDSASFRRQFRLRAA